jgi:pilus assembly protein CpaC
LVIKILKVLIYLCYVLNNSHAKCNVRSTLHCETIYLNDPTVTDVVIGNDQIVKAKKVGNKGIALTGVAAGDTTLKVWNGNRYFTSEIHVYPSNVKKTLEDLQTALRDIPKLSIQLVGDNVVLQGKDLTLEEKERVDGYASF